MKEHILNILGVSDTVVSGEALSAELGISRVSVWKHIHKLQELGYDIASTPKGYSLTGRPDTPFPWEFPGRQERIRYFSQISSTMDIARDIARKGCPDLTVVVAEHQTRGRGRLQRTWFSDKGGLYFTVVVRPVIPPLLSSRLNFLASVCLVKTLRGMYGINAQVKWPNDILVDGKKLTGMLSEMEAEGDMVSFVNIGIGVNVNNDPSPQEPRSASLIRILGHRASRKDILAGFLDDFESRITDLDRTDVVAEWKKHTMTLNRQVKVVTINESLEGRAMDVDKDGALILELADGSVRRVTYGDCFV
jgi:BirA family biotin operon repressor/biotin-[acetyl-CoA-carboxylase] ligase